MRRHFSVGASLLAVASAVAVARAEDILVPEDHRDLQEALDAASPGDTVHLRRGTYRGPFVLGTDRVAIVGEEGTRLLGPGYRRDTGEIPPALRVLADGFAVTGVSFQKGGLDVHGNDATVEGCAFRRIASRRTSAMVLVVMGARATVDGGTVDLGGRLPRNSVGIWVTGDDAVVTGVEINGAPHAVPMQVNGDRALLEGNAIDNARGFDGIILNGDKGTLAGNLMQGALLDVAGDGNAVLGNASTGVAFGLPSILVQGNGNLLEDNDARFGLDSGVVVRGNGNVLRRNTVAHNGSVVEGALLGNGFVVRGSGNLLEGNSAEGCVGEAFRVVGNSVWHSATGGWGPGPGNSIIGCTGTGAGTCGLGNWTTDTVVTGSTFTGNGVDVVDTGGFDQFEGNTFDTGGPGFEGSGNGANAPDFGRPFTGTGGGWDGFGD